MTSAWKSGIEYNASKNKADQLTTQQSISKQQIDVNTKAIEVQLASAQTKIDQAQALLNLYQKQEQSLSGPRRDNRNPRRPSHPNPGWPARSRRYICSGSHPDRQTQGQPEDRRRPQARDIQIGQPAEIDTHNGVIPGKVSRIDPGVLNGTVTVDVELTAALPQGARPDLSVDGTNRSGPHQRHAAGRAASHEQPEQAPSVFSNWIKTVKQQFESR